MLFRSQQKAWPAEFHREQAQQRGKQWDLQVQQPRLEALLASGLLPLSLPLKRIFAPKCREEETTGLAPGHMSGKHLLGAPVDKITPLSKWGGDLVGDSYNNSPLYSGPSSHLNERGREGRGNTCVTCSQCARRWTSVDVICGGLTRAPSQVHCQIGRAHV